MTVRRPGLMFHSMSRILKILAVTLGMSAPVALAQVLGPAMIATEHTRATLLSEQQAARPGTSFWVALKLEIDPGWHTYWKNPGDSGLPGDIAWTLPTGVTAGPIEWPIPERVPYGPLMNYGFHDKLVLPVKMTVAADAPAVAGAAIEASANWLVCADVCIPDQGSMAIPFAIAADAATSPGLASDEIAAAVAAIPKPALWPVSVSRTGDDWRLVADGGWAKAPAIVEFYPDLGGLIDNAAPQRVSFNGGRLTVSVKADITLDTKPERINGLLVIADTAGGERMGVTFSSPVGVAAAAGEPQALGQSAPAPAPVGLVAAIVFAFLGGLILNLMPCVLPVLAMKAVALARSGHNAQREGLAYTAGVMVTFALLAAALLAVRDGGTRFGWGFQLQEPGFVAVMAAIVLALGLMLSGVFSVGGGIMGVGQNLTARRDALGAFFTGALAVVVATPCTAPFMGSAMAFALTQPFAVSLLVFEALALGLAAPFLMISLVPAAARLIPKPGAWMDTFKQVLAFPMYATAAWLVWVLTQQTGPEGVAAALAALVLVALAAWSWGRVQQGGGRLATGAVGIAALAFGIGLIGQVAASSRPTSAGAATSSALASEPFSVDRLAQLRAEGRPVFVNFTAAWCITCLVNERVAFSSGDVHDAMTRSNVAYLKADWTNYDPGIGAILASYGRVGVPLYLYFAPNAEQAVVLPQVLTPGTVVAALAGGVASQ